MSVGAGRPGLSRRRRRRLAGIAGAVLLGWGCASSGSGQVNVVRRAPDSGLREDLVTLRSVYENVRFDGEYGLMVREGDGTLEVHWITREPRPGILRVFVGDSLLHETITPAHLAHGAVFDRPDAERLTLEYGSPESPENLARTVLDLDGTPPPEHVLAAVDSIFAVGDVHGEYDTLVDVLYNAGLLDEDLNWYGGRAHIVFLGDLYDRGDDVTKLLWFLYGLERQARDAGGRVHVLLGNHETMVFTGDLRYVSTKERLIPDFYDTTYPGLFDIRSTVLGKWLSTKPGLLQIGGFLFAHGGVPPAYADYSVEAFNDTLSTFISEDLFYRWADTTYMPEIDQEAYERRWDFFFGDESVFWYRGYVTSDTLGDALGEVLDRYEAEAHVVAHTPVTPIRSMYEGRLIAVDLNDPASQMLFLERDGDTYRRWAFGSRGAPEPLEGEAMKSEGPGLPEPEPSGKDVPR